MNTQIFGKQQDHINPDQLQKSLYQLLEQISKRNQKISWISAEKAAALQVFMEKEQDMLNKLSEKDAILSEKDAILLYTQAQLAVREAQLHEIVASRTWQFALLVQRIRVFLVPPQSRRAQILRQGLSIISLPFKKINRN